MIKSRNPKTGHVLRVRKVWTGLNWDDGYKDNRGRFRVYRPDYPRAYSEGYAMRSHVVWWLQHGEPHPKGTELHHRDKNRLNDSVENLEPLSNSAHQKKHKQIKLHSAICAHCGKPFKYVAWRDKERVTKFCSQKCYQAHPKSPESVAKRAASNTGKKRHPSFGLKMKAYWSEWRKRHK